MRRARASRTMILVLVITLGLVACSDETSEPTTAELLEDVEGRRLTPAEVARREQVAELLCGLDEAVLREAWDLLERPQLEFHDFVFSRHCPERNALYAQATGRFSLEETEG